MGGGRIKYLDISKGFAIVLMILGHCVLPNRYIGTLIFIFHMPLFFIACGFLSLPITDFNASQKFRKIFVPYFIVFALSIIPYYIICGNFDILWIFSLMKCRSLFGNDFAFGIGPVWFLPCYYFCNICISKLQNILSYNGILLGSFVLFSILYVVSKIVNGLPFLLYQTALGILFIILGYKCKEKNYLKNKLFVMLGIFSTLLCLQYGYFSMYSVECKLWIIQIIAGLFCTLVLFECAKKIKSCTPLEWISKNSLIILCIHSFDWSFGISSYFRASLNLTIYSQFIFYCIFIVIGLLFIKLSKNCITKLKRVYQ